MKIYRAIQTDNIDINNVGCHWTWNCEVAENVYKVVYGGCSDDFDETAVVKIIEAEIDQNAIDFEATMYSICEYPAEFEIVLKKNVQIGEYNTGSRVDDWVNSIERSEEETIENVRHQITYRNTNREAFATSLNMMRELFQLEY